MLLHDFTQIYVSTIYIQEVGAKEEFNDRPSSGIGIKENRYSFWEIPPKKFGIVVS